MGWRGFPLVFVTACVTVATYGCGDDSSERAATTGLPPGAVAMVGDQPITRAELERHIALLERGKANPEGDGDDALENAAMKKLLLQAAVVAEAGRRGVRVADRSIDAQLAETKRRLGSDTAYRDLLGPLREDDLRKQLLLTALSAKLVANTHAKGEDASNLIETLPRRWRNKTTCLDDYRVSACGG